MAVVAPSVVNVSMHDITAGTDDKAHIVTWVLASGDTATPVVMPYSTDRSVQVEGTFTGSSITIEGSNDGTNYRTLRDPFNITLVMSVADVRQILEVSRFIRPTLAGAGPLTVSLLLVRRPK